MKKSEFIEKLEEGELIGFTEMEKQIAVDMARRYTGRIVLAEWKAWVCNSNDGFALFSAALPQILLDKEAVKKEPAGEASDNISEGKTGVNPFDQVRKVLNITNKMKNLEDDLWVYDDNIGWTVHGCPVF